MNFKALNLFLSEDNIRRHIEHNNSVKLKLSILEKSVPKIIGCSICEIKQMKLDKDIKEEAARLIGYIRSHDLFFDSLIMRAAIRPYGSNNYYIISTQRHYRSILASCIYSRTGEEE